MVNRMMWWRCFFIFFMVLISKVVISQCVLTGTLTDQSQEPLIGATVYLIQSKSGTNTNIQGQYRLQNLSIGKTIVQYSYLGKISRSDTIYLTKGANTNDVVLLDNAQQIQDIEIKEDKTAEVGLKRLNQIEGTAIYAGKTNTRIKSAQLVSNKSTNNARQAFAKVSGLNIWESDGAGLQIGIGGRGLNPSRNSNFNTRQNSYDISADALGYPESYYSPPLAAVEEIQVVRGAASLQYGTQFGGLLNFKMKRGVTDKKIGVMLSQTVGSFDMYTTQASVGGQVKKLNYYTFYQYKRRKGWRPNASLQQHTGYAHIDYQINEKTNIGFDFTHSQYLAQQPGGLTDAQFANDPRQSNRARNWFGVNWNVAAINIKYEFNKKLKYESSTFGLLGYRNAVGNLGRINLVDFGGERDLLKDEFRNLGHESRMLYRYNIKAQENALVVGARLYTGFTTRKDGLGSAGSDANFTYNNPELLEGSDFELPSYNAAIFAENVFNILPNKSAASYPRITITPGLRFEYINTQANGYYRILDERNGQVLRDEQVFENRKNARSFLLSGLGVGVKTNSNTELYANVSQNYRGISFNDIRVSVGSQRIDPNLSDERGFNADLGIRGNIKGVFDYDLTAYHLNYRDRIGLVLLTETDSLTGVPTVFNYRTNIADAAVFGVESVFELYLVQLFTKKERTWFLNLFGNISLTDARYRRSEQNGVEGNRVELVPPLMMKYGINLKVQRFKAALQYSYVEDHFSDASNALLTPTAVEGVIERYQVVDFSAEYSYKWLKLETGVNNLFNATYFTRRASGYPGPGIIPADGRNFYLTLSARF